MTIKRERAFRECRRESFPFSYALKKIKAKVGFGRINYEKNNNPELFTTLPRMWLKAT